MNDLFDNWIYENNADNSARYALGEKGCPLICVGINPSTAEPNKLDPTLRIVKNTAARLGHSGWVMLNLYPQRATNPDDLHAEMDPVIVRENIEAFKRHLGGSNPINIWAAWGTLINKRPYLLECLEGFSNVMNGFYQSPFTVVNVFSIGKRSKDGHPHHPLYLPKNSEVEYFDLKEYLQMLKGKIK